MITTPTPNFSTLITPDRAKTLWLLLDGLVTVTEDQSAMIPLSVNELLKFGRPDFTNEKEATTWLIKLFNSLFKPQHTILVRGDHEPEYFPETFDQPAQIVFAHGYFASALHEISHWCIAGKKRRKFNDFGYWYAPDGRTAQQQAAFEKVEIKPQALECLFTLSCQRRFQVSQDNLFADFDTTQSTFAANVYHQAANYLQNPHELPKDAQWLLWAFLTIHYAC